MKTVETYKARAMEKTGLRNRVEIIRHGVERGWLTEPEKSVTVAQQHLGVPEEQGALRREGKMQAAQNVSLSLGIHVHQRVTTYQQIDPGYGRVPD